MPSKTPQGYYSAKEAGRLLGFDGQTWAETIRENTSAATVAAINYGIDISGVCVYVPKDAVDEKVRRLQRYRND